MTLTRPSPHTTVAACLPFFGWVISWISLTSCSRHLVPDGLHILTEDDHDSSHPAVDWLARKSLGASSAIAHARERNGRRRSA